MLVAHAGGRAGAARLLRRGARTRPRGSRAPSWCRSTCPSATRCRSSTSAPRPCGSYGNPAGVCAAAERFGTVPLADLARAGDRRSRARASLVTEAQAYILEILGRSSTPRPSAGRCCAPEGRVLRAGRAAAQPRAGDALERLGRRRRRAVLHRRHRRRRSSDWVIERGGILGRDDLAAYEVVAREPVRVALPRPRGAHQPAAVGGRHPDRLRARSCSTASSGRRRRWTQIVAAMALANAERTPEFLEGLGDAGVRRALPRLRGWARRPTSRCSTSTGGPARSPAPTARARASSSPAPASTSTTCSASRTSTRSGFHRHAPGRRLPSMMAPTIVLRDGEPELVARQRRAPTASARRSSRRSWAWSTTGSSAGPAVEAPRVHFEDGVV